MSSNPKKIRFPRFFILLVLIPLVFSAGRCRSVTTYTLQGNVVMTNNCILFVSIMVFFRRLSSTRKTGYRLQATQPKHYSLAFQQ